MKKINRYGWKPQRFDSRDEVYRWQVPADLVLPPSVDLQPGCPEVYNQGQLGSCTAHAITGALEFEMGKDPSLPAFKPSRLFIYYNERVMEGDPEQDGGAEIRDGIKSVSTLGVPAEDDWPYVEDQFAVKPPVQVYTEAEMFDAFTRKKILYQPINQDLIHLKSCLASGWPFPFGFKVYPAFESDEVAASGIVPMPGPGEAEIGGHAVLCVGYDDSKQAFKVRNSWGSGWGLKGYFWIPYAYLTSKILASDFWAIKLIQAVEQTITHPAELPKEGTMPHDKNGKEIKVGDTVTMEMQVGSITPGATSCNVTLIEKTARPGYSLRSILTDADICELDAVKVSGPSLADLMTKFEMLQAQIEDFVNFVPSTISSVPHPEPSKVLLGNPSLPIAPPVPSKPPQPAKPYKAILRVDPPAPKKP